MHYQPLLNMAIIENWLSSKCCKGLGARTVEIGLVSEMYIFFICVKGVNLMEKNACFIEIALKLLELRGYKETHPYPFLRRKIT